MLRLTAEFYNAAGIRAAVQTLDDFGSFEWNDSPEDGYFQVAITAAEDVDPSDLEGEFGNFALACSIEATREAQES